VAACQRTLYENVVRYASGYFSRFSLHRPTRRNGWVRRMRLIALPRRIRLRHQAAKWAFRVEGKTQRRCWYLAASSRLKQEPAQRDVSDAAIPLPLPRPRVGTVPTTRDIVTALPAQASTSDERNTQGMATAQGTELNKNSSINATPVPESSTPSAPSADAESVRNQPTADEATEANIAPSIPETSADATHDASDGRTEQRISAPNAPPAGIPPQETAGAAGVSAI